jgi:RNA polymerase sigma-70 factor (ECF subfamily)
MAKNLTMNHIRKDSNYRMILEQQEKLSSFIVEDNSLEYAEFQYSLYDCIENLSNRGKEILLLHRLKGLKQKEIADKLNITVKTVKNQIWISLQKLRNCLQHKGVSI